jgi:NAD-dependent deacetylase
VAASEPTSDGLAADLARLIADTSRLVALTGAGVSTGSGIPDFRGPDGLWTRDPQAEQDATIDTYVGDPEVRRAVWQQRVTSPVLSAVPNAAHDALVTLERRGHLDAVITQNVDGLHQLAGNDPDKVIEVHGSVHGARCLTCGWTAPMAGVLGRVRQGEVDPRCPVCGGVITATTVAFGEALDPAVLQRAHDASVGAEVFLAVGTSLVVHPVALLPRTAVRAGATLAIVGQGETPYDDEAALVLDGDAGEVLRAVVDALP